MKTPKYLYRSEPLLKVYEFTSEGPKGRVRKMVQFIDTGTENFFNLAFGDYDEENKSMNDLAVTNNGDSLKVLATVASTVMLLQRNIPMPGSLPLEALM